MQPDGYIIQKRKARYRLCPLQVGMFHKRWKHLLDYMRLTILNSALWFPFSQCSLEQLYKTFHWGNLLPFQGNTVIPCYKTIFFGNYYGIMVSNTAVINHVVSTLEHVSAMVNYPSIVIGPLV